MSTPPLPSGLPSSPLYEVTNHLHSVAIRLLRRARVVDRESGLSPERLSLLSVLVYAGPHTLSQLADAEQVSRPAISRSIKGLVSDGLVHRERDGNDRRSVIVHATSSGRRLMEAARKRRLERVAADLEGLDHSQLNVLLHAAEILHSVAISATTKGTE